MFNKACIYDSSSSIDIGFLFCLNLKFSENDRQAYRN